MKLYTRWFDQAVTMLSRDGGGGERERWLDWVLSQLLDPGIHIKLGTPAREHKYLLLTCLFQYKLLLFFTEKFCKTYHRFTKYMLIILARKHQFQPPRIIQSGGCI